jgi:carboxyl-terminal processing protease
MRRSVVFLPALILFFCSFAYGRSGPAAPPADSLPLPCQQKAERLLDEALHFMQKTYYRKDQVQWNELTTSARTKLANSGNCDDVYSAITWCFHQLNEQHSFIMSPEKAARYDFDPESHSAPPSLSELVGEIKGEWLQDSIAYLSIPWVSTMDSLVCEQIADSLQKEIARLDTKRISKWIIDLRKNTGGNCWPMLAGIGPLLGDGVCGYFVSAHERVPISYKDGAALQGRHVRCQVSSNGYHIKNDQRSIVVLTGRRTVSAGEIVALAFKGRGKTYLIGEPTAGLTTANATYSLSDRSMLVLSVCQEADYTGRICEGSIVPDKRISSPQPSDTPDTTSNDPDPVKTAAISWLMAQ